MTRNNRQHGQRLFAGITVFVLLGVGYVAAQNPPYGYVPNIGVAKKAFSFAIWGDPQVAFYAPGTKFDNPDSKKNYETVVPRLQQAVALTNQLKPEFVVTLGDNIHNTGEWENFNLFVQTVKPLQMPLYLLMGNHDHVPEADTFATNPIKNREFANFVWAQQQINGLELVVYSFDAGDWHLVLFSQPGGNGYGIDDFMEKHPEFLSWLDADLQANRERPTMFFTHHPLLPVGRAQFDTYGPGAANRAALMNLLTRYGNVKFAFFGHVHNTVASIPEISWRYKGTAFILMPNSANFIRAADYLETAKSSWGVGMVKLNGKVCEAITFHTLADEAVTIDPDEFAEYDDAVYGYLQPEWDWPAGARLRNASFEEPLTGGWFVNHLLRYDTPPIQKRMIQPRGASRQNLYLYTKAKDRQVSTNSYLTSEVRQALTPPAAERWPVLKLSYRIKSTEYLHPEVCRPYVMISGHKSQARVPQFAISYSLGSAFSFAGTRGAYVSLEIPPRFDDWNELLLYPRADFERYFPDKKWETLELQRIVVTLGVMNENYTPNSEPVEVGVAFDALDWSTVDTPTPTTVEVAGAKYYQPASFQLYQNYPNPFNPSTTISFALLQTAEVRVQVYDLAGRLLATIQDGRMNAGAYALNWTPQEEVASGVYLLKFTANEFVRTKKMVLVR